MRPQPSLGKWRRLQQAASARGTFSVLAMDHRGPLRRALAKQVGNADVDNLLSSIKCDIVRELGPSCSAVLLDPETGVAPCISKGALPGATGLLVALDTGSTGDPAVLKTGLVENWSVQQTVATGAVGAKLLVYYHPEAPDAHAVEHLVETIGRSCAEAQLPFYLEPLSYSPEPPGCKRPAPERRKVVIEAARRLVPLGVDVLKAEFPVDIAEEPDRETWREACEELSSVCAVPWVLLSAGVSFETFLRQTQVACEAGASGVMAGRAIWKEAVTIDSHARGDFLRGLGRGRMSRLRSLCEALGKPFTDCLARSDPTALATA